MSSSLHGVRRPLTVEPHPTLGTPGAESPCQDSDPLALAAEPALRRPLLPCTPLLQEASGAGMEATQVAAASCGHWGTVWSQWRAEHKPREHGGSMGPPPRPAHPGILA